MSTQSLTTKSLFDRDDVKAKFQELLGKRSTSFITSVLQIVASNDLLKTADPSSIYQSAAVAATLDLPLNNNLGFAYIVPFNSRQKDGSFKQVAQFQLGYKGFIQLAQRTGLFKELDAKPVYEGQIIEDNSMRGYHFKWSEKKSTKLIGYVAWFCLLNGFEAMLYMPVEDLSKHGKKYSQTFKKGFGLWSDDFEGMCRKTVIKLLLSRFAPLSIDTQMQRAIIADQAVIKNAETLDVDYADNADELKTVREIEDEKRTQDTLKYISEAKTSFELEALREFCTSPELVEALEKRITEISK